MLILNNTTEAAGGPHSAPETSMPTLKAGRRNRKPTHPGAIVRSSLEALDIPVNQAALAMGMTRANLGLVVNEKQPVTVDSAVLLAAYLGTGQKGAEHLLGMQMDFDLWHARARLKGRLAKIIPAHRPRR